MAITKSKHFRHLLLIFGLGVSLAPWTFTAEAHPPKSGDQAGASGNRANNSREGGRTNQGEARLDLVLVQAPLVLPGPITRRFPKGSRLERLAASDHALLDLTPNFFAAADPRGSFDGARVLFAGKKTAQSPWQIWEMSVDGSGVRQVTHCPTDCLRPAYLPRDEVVYTAVAQDAPTGAAQTSARSRSARPAAESATWMDRASELWVSKVDGSDARPITFGPGDFLVETVLKNGVILVTARSPLLPSNGSQVDRELYTLRPDGTALATLRCDHQHPAIRSQAKELDDGSVVFVKAPLTGASLDGELAWIRRGALHNSLLTAAPILVSSPQPVGADELLVARESVSRLTFARKLTLQAFDAATGKFGSAIYDDPALSTVEAVPVAAHESPRWYWSTLNPALHRGYFICLDSHLAQGVPHGRIEAKLAQVRVLTLDAATATDMPLGEAPIEEDGSFYIAVPPDKPVRFEVLDSAGRVVRVQRSWIWARSGEERGCVGCHEDRAVAPENRWPMALRRFDTPIELKSAKGLPRVTRGNDEASAPTICPRGNGR